MAGSTPMPNPPGKFIRDDFNRLTLVDYAGLALMRYHGAEGWVISLRAADWEMWVDVAKAILWVDTDGMVRNEER